MQCPECGSPLIVSTVDERLDGRPYRGPFLCNGCGHRGMPKDFSHFDPALQDKYKANLFKQAQALIDHLREIGAPISAMLERAAEDKNTE